MVSEKPINRYYSPSSSWPSFRKQKVHSFRDNRKGMGGMVRVVQCIIKRKKNYPAVARTWWVYWNKKKKKPIALTFSFVSFSFIWSSFVSSSFSSFVSSSSFLSSSFCFARCIPFIRKIIKRKWGRAWWVYLNKKEK